MSRRLDLLVPGLFGPVPVSPDDLPPVPVLTRLLGRADRLPGPGGGALADASARPGQAAAADPLATLFALFGILASPDRGYPSAPFCRLADGLEMDRGNYLLHADPIHLRPDRDRLVLFAGSRLAVTQEEAEALTAVFNQHFAADGLCLEAPTAASWYLRTQQPPHLVTSPLQVAMGRPVVGLLPRGPDARAWARILNEAQMLFHHADVNDRRKRAGLPAISGIWPWGGGRLADIQASADYGGVFATDNLTLGLAQAAGIPTAPLSADPAALIAAMTSPRATKLVHWHGLWNPVLEADGEAWVEALVALETWLARLLAGMGADLTLRLLAGDGEAFLYRPHHRYRFWRQPFSLGKRLSQA